MLDLCSLHLYLNFKRAKVRLLAMKFNKNKKEYKSQTKKLQIARNAEKSALNNQLTSLKNYSPLLL
jgi:hypothetical protein